MNCIIFSIPRTEIFTSALLNRNRNKIPKNKNKDNKVALIIYLAKAYNKAK